LVISTTGLMARTPARRNRSRIHKGRLGAIVDAAQDAAGEARARRGCLEVHRQVILMPGASAADRGT